MDRFRNIVRLSWLAPYRCGKSFHTKRRLRPLKAADRREKLIEVLSHHPRWNEVSHRLESAIKFLGPQMAGGRREGQVHVTLSRSGLVSRFNHYLTHGSETDQHAATQVLGCEGKELLAGYGEKTLIQLAIPGAMALQAAHPHFSMDDMRQRGDIPNIINEFTEAWSYRLAHPDFESRSLRTDSGMIFYSTVPSCYVNKIEVIEDS